MTTRQVLKKYLHFALMDKWRYFSIVIIIVVFAITSRTKPYLLGLVINALKVENYHEAYLFSSLLVTSYISTGLLMVLVYYQADKIISKTLLPESRLEYIKSLLDIDYEYHTRKSSGSLISLAKRGEGALSNAFVRVNIESLKVIFEFVVTTLIVISIDFQIGLVTMITIMATAIINYNFVKLNVRYRNDFNKEDDKITGLVVDNMIGYETVKIFANETWEQKRFRKSYEPWTEKLLRQLKTFKYIDLVSFIVPGIGLLILLNLAINKAEMGLLELGTVIACVYYLLDMSGRTSDFMYQIRDLAKSYADLVDFFKIMDLKPVIKDEPGAVELKKIQGNIKFTDVSFEYNTNQEVLQDISLSIKPNEKIALVGKSGSGKTTLTKLLMRFYDVKSGVITVDGNDIKQVKLESLRKQIGLVPQEPVLFNDTIKYNIIYGKHDATQEEVEEASKKANLHDFIMKLPLKYETIVGERGVKLSGGQKQRLAIARVILENPEIIVFDEATSQLDSENEKRIQAAFKNLTKQKTTIIIAHRLSTVMDADRIIVFDEGRIVETGKHNELIKNGGIYSKLWKLQTENLSLT